MASTPKPELGAPAFWTPAEIAERWKCDRSWVRKLFVDVPGVLKLGGDSGRRNGRRQYQTIRIPATILEKFEREHSR
jgi:hypothetical protein